MLGRLTLKVNRRRRSDGAGLELELLTRGGGMSSIRAISFCILRLHVLLVADEDERESEAFVLATGLSRTLAELDAGGYELLA